MNDLEKLQYPIGRFEAPQFYSEELLNDYKERIASLPDRLNAEVNTLNAKQLETTYRDGGWNIRQVVHHLADSHMNCLIRIKLTLTEDRPLIKPYIEQKWAELPDSKLPIEVSLELLKGIHLKLHVLMSAFRPEDLNKEYLHPQYEKSFSLQEAMALYAWHGKHHLAHIIAAKKRMQG